MHVDVPHALLPLAPDEPMRLHTDASLRLRVVSGNAWLTADHEPTDRVLPPGAEWTVPGGEDITLSALGGPAVLDLSDTVAPGAPAAPQRPLRPPTGDQAPHLATHCAGLA